MKKSTFFQGLFIALFVLTSKGLTAQCPAVIQDCFEIPVLVEH